MNKTPVIFIDFGGVYFKMPDGPVSRRFSKEFGVPQEKIMDILMGSSWTAHATGKWDEKTFWKHFSDKLNISGKQTEKFRKALYGYSFLNKGMALLIKRLKKKYRVAALSSIIVGWVEVLEKKYKISKRFHENHYTYDHGVDKPSARFFRSAAKKMNVKPADCIVVDDMKPFLAAVEKTGARTILFKNARQLEAQLKKMGVEI